MPDSYPFPTYSGLLSPEHYKRIGSALWLFLWCVSSTTKEVEKNGIMWGIVLGNKPLKLPEIADIFEVNEKTVRRWLNALEENEYIKITRAPYGLILTVKNSKKWTKNRLDKNVQSLTKTETKVSNHTDKDVQSENREWTEMSEQNGQKCPIYSDKNVQSNKDITVDITKDITNKEAAANKVYIDLDPKGESDGVPSTDPLSGDSLTLAEDEEEISHTPKKRILDRYVELRGRGLETSPKDEMAADEIIKAGVSIEDAIKWLEERFDSYKPKHSRDSIRSLDYCVGYILDKHYETHILHKQEKPNRKQPYKNPRVDKLPKWMEDAEKKVVNGTDMQPPNEPKKNNGEAKKWLENYIKGL